MGKKASRGTSVANSEPVAPSAFDAAELPEGYPISEFDYRVAELAWCDGLSSNVIVERLKLEKTPQNITRVRRALEKAVRHGIMELHPPQNLHLESQLKEAFGQLRDVHVEVDRTAACLRAAKIVAAEIEAFLRGPNRQLIVANSGGRTVRDTVTCLQRLVPVAPMTKDKSLVFISLNAAEAHDRYDECANFLSVRLAQIYEAKHFAVVKPWDEQTGNAYGEALLNIDLMISSAGGSDAFLSYWLAGRNEQVPPNAVGDVAFHLIDKLGNPVELKERNQQLLEDDLLRSPNWNDLSRLFRNQKVLLVLAGDREDVGFALLDSAIAGRCVLDSHLARALVNRKNLASTVDSLK